MIVKLTFLNNKDITTSVGKKYFIKKATSRLRTDETRMGEFSERKVTRSVTSKLSKDDKIGTLTSKVGILVASRKYLCSNIIGFYNVLRNT